MINETIITYFGQPARVNCDRLCSKAWGISGRPVVYLSENEDDYAFLADGELTDAPADPGTYEGGQGKPSSPDYFPTKWCVRECERCNMSAPGESTNPLPVRDFSKRRFNMYWRENQAETFDG